MGGATHGDPELNEALHNVRANKDLFRHDCRGGQVFVEGREGALKTARPPASESKLYTPSLGCDIDSACRIAFGKPAGNGKDT
jgi:hypothetical protein